MTPPRVPMTLTLNATQILSDNIAACVHGGGWGGETMDGGQGEMVRVPLADGTLVKIPEGEYSDDMLASLLTLSDVMGTGHHAAMSA